MRFFAFHKTATMNEAELSRQLARARKLLHSQSSETLTIALDVRKQAQTLQLPELEVRALCILAQCLYDFGDYNESLGYLAEVTELSAQISIGIQEGEQLQIYARTHYSMGNYPKARDYWQRCLTLPDSAIILETRIRAHIGLGQLYYAHEHYESALAHHRRAEELAASSDDYQLQAAILINIAVDLMSCKQLDEAHAVLKDALPLVKADQNYRNEAEIYTLIGQIQLLRGEYDKARMSLMVALKINRLHINQWGEASAMLILGKVYLATGYIEMAREQLVEALNKACGLGAIHMQCNIHEVLAIIYTQLEKTEIAEGHHNLRDALRKQLLDSTLETDLETMELRLELI
ncbi:tetratricopeptide repeat protein [Chitinibacter sp. S2-10]|uniref:tetratricopeptide repeat protein n=1 Tax=Chitinibacter sp. S2-10 TaxID=3373597 RepID=UPI00397783C6